MLREGNLSLKKILRGNNLALEQLNKKSFFLERTITNAMYVLLPEKHENSLQHIFFSLKYSRPRISKQVPLSCGNSKGDCISLKVRFTFSRKQKKKHKSLIFLKCFILMTLHSKTKHLRSLVQSFV